MHERDWLGRPATIIFAVALLIIGLAYMGDKILKGWVGVHDANAAYQQNAEADRDKSADEIAEDCQDPDVVFRDCVRKNLEAHYKDQATNEDLQAQQDMAYWAFWLLIASAVGIIVSCFGVVLLIRSIDLGREANIQARKAADAAVSANQMMRQEQRPWVTLDRDLICEITETDHGISLTWHYNFSNKGKSPAHDIRLSLKPIRRSGLVDIHKDVRDYADACVANPPKFGGASILFPGKSTDFRKPNVASSFSYNSDKSPVDGGDTMMLICLTYLKGMGADDIGVEAVMVGFDNSDGRLGPSTVKVKNYASTMYIK